MLRICVNDVCFRGCGAWLRKGTIGYREIGRCTIARIHPRHPGNGPDKTAGPGKCSAVLRGLDVRRTRGQRASPAITPSMLPMEFLNVAVFIDHVFGALLRYLFGCTDARIYLDLLVLDDYGPLRHIGIGSLEGDVLSLLDDGKLLRSVDRLDLVPGKTQIAGHVAMKGHFSLGFAHKFAGELIAVSENKNIAGACSLTESVRGDDRECENQGQQSNRSKIAKSFEHQFSPNFAIH